MSITERPASVTTTWINLAALGALLITLFFFWPRGWIWEQQACLALGLVIVPVTLLESLKRWREGTWPELIHPLRWTRVLKKYIAFVATLGIIAFFYWLFPHYHNIEYGHIYLTALTVLPWFLPISLLYFAYMDRLLGDEPDGYSEFAALLAGKTAGRQWSLLKEHALGWTVKAFFLPLMFSFVIQNLAMQMELQQNADMSDLGKYFYITHMIYFVDVAFAAAGYVMTIRLFDSHIRSTEPTMIGWMVAIICYQPFWNFLYNQYFSYGWNGDWVSWLAGYPNLQIAWGSVIILLLIIYSSATVCFGIRFSNLTWRGLISQGPYRLSKHPAYLSKNITWWMISIPFAMTGTFTEALRLTLLLGCVSFIYFLRAWTEERHLSRYAEYRDYCHWISEHGPLRFLPFPKGHWQR